MGTVIHLCLTSCGCGRGTGFLLAFDPVEFRTSAAQLCIHTCCFSTFTFNDSLSENICLIVRCNMLQYMRISMRRCLELKIITIIIQTLPEFILAFLNRSSNAFRRRQHSKANLVSENKSNVLSFTKTRSRPSTHLQFPLARDLLR